MMYCREDELPDSFYEFGVEDYARVMQGYSNAKARSEAGMRTAKMREEEESLRARRFPTTKLRIQFPDSITLQVHSCNWIPPTWLLSMIPVAHALPSCIAAGICMQRPPNRISASLAWYKLHNVPLM